MLKATKEGKIGGAWWSAFVGGAIGSLLASKIASPSLSTDNALNTALAIQIIGITVFLVMIAFAIFKRVHWNTTGKNWLKIWGGNPKKVR